MSNITPNFSSINMELHKTCRSLAACVSGKPFTQSVVDELISHYPDIITVVDSCCELERTSAGRTSPSVSLTTLPSSLSPSHPDHQPDQKCKQDLIRFLNTSFKKGLRVVDGVNQSNQDFAHRKSRLNTFKDTWDKMKDDYGPVAAEFPSTTLSSLEKICTYSADHMAQLNTWISGPQVFDLPEQVQEMREQVLQEVILNICQIQVELDSLPSLGEKDQLTSKQLQGDLASLNTRINEFGATIASAVKQLAPLEKQFHLCSTLND